MSWTSRFSSRLRGLFLNDRLERELDDEVRFHLEMQAEDNLRAGMDPAEARYAAMRSFGGADRMKEQYRDGRAFAAVETMVQDLRYALRAMRGNPGFTAVAVLSLALGIGANTAIFSLIDALLLRSLPVRDPQHLVQLVVPQGTAPPFVTFTYPMIHALADHNEIFSGLFGYSSAMFNAGPKDAIEKTPGAWVTGDYYETLGLEPIAGRLLTQDDDRVGARPVAVITEGYWSRKFGRDLKAIGQTIQVEGVPATIVGVSPAGFTGMDVGQNSDVTLAAGAEPQFEQASQWNIGTSYFTRLIFARPRADLPLTQVKARLAVLWPAVATANPDSPFKKELSLPLDLIPGGTGWTGLRSQFRRPLLVLMAVAGLVLLIACANIANLLLARASARQREIAVRLAIGAGRGRIIRQLLTESALLSACGAALGIGLAWFGSSFIVQLLSSGQYNPIQLDVAPHGHVLLFTTLVAVATAMLFGIAPAFRATGAGPAAALKDTSAQVTSRTGFASALVVLQVSLSLMLLVGAGLFVGTLRNLRHLDAGFRHEGVFIVNVDNPRRDRRELLDRMGSLPGVVSASFSNNTVLSGGTITNMVSLPGRSPVVVDFDWIGPKYFETLRTPLLQGREFTVRDDKTAPRVAIVNQAFVQRFFPDGRPLGQYFSIGLPPMATQIVGVVQDALSHSLRDGGAPAVYVPNFERTASGTNFEVYAKGSIAQVVSELRSEIHPIEIHPLTEQVEKTLVQERLMATLAGSFGALALILASIGLYGLLAYAVARRINEIGIRMALGAGRTDVLRMVIRDALRLLALGMALGLSAAWAASRWVSSMLFGLTPTDPITIFAATALLTAFGLLAGFLPALRASRVDPIVALRYE